MAQRPIIERLADGREVWNLDQVVRDVLEAVLEDRSWSQNRAARELGLDQKTLNRFLRGDQGTTLAMLARICAGLDTDPVRFIGAHPGLGPHAHVKAARNRLQDRLRVVLSPDEQEGFVRLLEAAKAHGVLTLAQDRLRDVVEGAAAGATHERAQARKIARKKAAPKKR